MKKISAKQVCGVIVVLGILLCLGVYLLVFNKYREETAKLKKSNDQLEEEVKELKPYYDNREIYAKSIVEMKQVIEEVTADYPGNAREEDVVMMAVAMQRNAVINFNKINIEATKPIYSIPLETVQELKNEELTMPIVFYAKAVTYDCTTNYGNFKEAVKTVYDDAYRVGINAVSFKKDGDDNNYIKGTIDIVYYSLDGMNKGYEAPQIPEYTAGTNDLFGLHDVENLTTNENAEVAEEAAN